MFGLEMDQLAKIKVIEPEIAPFWKVILVESPLIVPPLDGSMVSAFSISSFIATSL